jgi:hypothetical protein
MQKVPLAILRIRRALLQNHRITFWPYAALRVGHFFHGIRVIGMAVG